MVKTTEQYAKDIDAAHSTLLLVVAIADAHGIDHADPNWLREHAKNCVENSANQGFAYMDAVLDAIVRNSTIIMQGITEHFREQHPDALKE